MANIVIKKRIDLDFLGEDHKESYLMFKAMPVVEYQSFIKNTPDQRVDEINYIVKIMQDKFIEGKFGSESVEAKDIPLFDEGTLAKCFAVLTGQADPKVE